MSRRDNVIPFDQTTMAVSKDLHQRINVLTQELQHTAQNFHMISMQTAQDIGRMGFYVNFCMNMLKKLVPKEELDAAFDKFKVEYSAEQAKIAEDMMKEVDKQNQTEEKPAEEPLTTPLVTL